MEQPKKCRIYILYIEKILCSVTKGVFDKIKLSTVLKHLYLNNKTAPSISAVTFQVGFISGVGEDV